MYAFVPEGRIDISIHTPLAGSDDTRPDAGMVRVISIHTPLAGSDRGRPGIRQRFAISIHTPLAGSD